MHKVVKSILILILCLIGAFVVGYFVYVAKVC